MIKFKGVNEANNTEFYGFGLTNKNLELLKKSKPIFIEGDTINSLYDYIIFYGETEEEILSDLKKFIGPDTITNFKPD